MGHGPPDLARRGPLHAGGSGRSLITVSVIFSRDPTSAYALLYLFPCVYVYYFLTRTDAVLHIAFAALNYLLAILVIGEMAGAPMVEPGSVLHHLVITIGSLIVVGAMLCYLRRRVELLIAEIVESARTDLQHRPAQRARPDRDPRRRDRAGPDGRPSGRSADDPGRAASSTCAPSSASARRRRRSSRSASCSTTRPGRIDAVARTGTAEFSVCLPETDENTAFLLAEQLLARFRRSFREWEIVALD